MQKLRHSEIGPSLKGISMLLQSAVIDRLFGRLSATYGREFLSRYEGVDEAAVKAAWAHELSGFAGRLDAIAWALDRLPQRAPNAIEFRALCRAAPVPDVPRIEQAAAAVEVVRAELARIGPLRVGAAGDAWARRVLAKHARGEPVSRYARTMAAEALGRQVTAADAPAPSECGNGLEGSKAC